MIVALASLLLSVAVGTGAGFAVYWLTSRRAGRRIRQFAAIVAGFLVLSSMIVPITSWMTETVATTIIEMDPREGARRLEFLGLPENSTSDFCYRISPIGITVLADFEMSESDFLSWMALQNWNAVEFDLASARSTIHMPCDTVVYPVRQYETRTPLTVARGYCYFSAKPGNSDNTDRVIYDLDSGRVYVQCTTY